MDIGLLAYATNTGLGYQTKTIYDNLNPTKTLLVDLSRFNQMPLNTNWYPKAQYCGGFPKQTDIDWFTDGVDVIIECETPLNYQLHQTAKDKGVPIVQIYNREFLDYFKNPDWPKPALLVSPTSWCLDEVKNLNAAPTEQWSMPIDTTQIPARQIEHLETYVHILGRPTVHDRNGTIQFLEAANQIGSRYKYKIYMQQPGDHRAKEFFQPVQDALNRYDGLAEIIVDTPDNKTMYETGEVLVLPRRYGGLCLPMLEALAAGMPVIMTDIEPNRDLLPKQWLADTTFTMRYQAHTDWDIYTANPTSLANTMKFFQHDGELQWASKRAKEIAKTQSWETQKPIWEKRLCELFQ